MDKPAMTQVPIHELLARRWSPRAFDPARNLSREQITALCEAARWAPSCFGDEPWRFVLCDRASDEAAWRAALGCLTEKNQRWAQHAPLLVAVSAAERFAHNAKPNRWGQYDSGAAAENLCLQATALGLSAHQMGGFDAAKVRESLGVPPDYHCMAMVAVGYQAPAETLAEEFREAEAAARRRQPLGSRFFAGRWERPWP